MWANIKSGLENIVRARCHACCYDTDQSFVEPFSTIALLVPVASLLRNRHCLRPWESRLGRGESFKARKDIQAWGPSFQGDVCRTLGPGMVSILQLVACGSHVSCFST